MLYFRDFFALSNFYFLGIINSTYATEPGHIFPKLSPLMRPLKNFEAQNIFENFKKYIKISKFSPKVTII